MSVTHIQQAAEKRRSIYALNKQLPVPAADVVKIIEHAVKHHAVCVQLAVHPSGGPAGRRA